MKEYCVEINTEFLVLAEDEFDAQQKAFDRFVDKGYRGAMTVTPTGVEYGESSTEDDQ